MVVALVAAACLIAPPAFAHETKVVGPYRVTIGWSNEPAYSGATNAVEFTVADAAGEPVGAAGVTLSVEISFGDDRVTLPLLPVEEPGEFDATIIPTRPGTYAFHVMGAVKDQPIDVSSTCSETTFECVADASEVEFPDATPAPAQLGDAVVRALARADKAEDSAAGARALALAAVAVAVLALAAAIGLAVRSRKRG